MKHLMNQNQYFPFFKPGKYLAKNLMWSQCREIRINLYRKTESEESVSTKYWSWFFARFVDNFYVCICWYESFDTKKVPVKVQEEVKEIKIILERKDFVANYATESVV